MKIRLLTCLGVGAAISVVALIPTLTSAEVFPKLDVLTLPVILLTPGFAADYGNHEGFGSSAILHLLWFFIGTLIYGTISLLISPLITLFIPRRRSTTAAP